MPEATKDLRFGLPAGLIGNPEVLPKCTSVEFDALLPEDWNACPSETAIGVAQVYLTSVQYAPIVVPLFNLVPSVGEPAKFGFEIFHVPIILDTSVRTGGDYGVVVSVNNISQVFPFFANQVTFWGVPQDPRHNAVRGWNCLSRTIYPEFAEFWPACVSPVNPKITPFLSLPTSCTSAPLNTFCQLEPLFHRMVPVPWSVPVMVPASGKRTTMVVASTTFPNAVGRFAYDMFTTTLLPD